MQLSTDYLRVSVAIVLSVTCVLSPAIAQPTVDTPAGQITGTTDKDFMVDKFLGIPFAEPPVGPLRFKKTTLRGKFTNTFLATQYRKSCGEDEDCLFLNIYAPSSARQGSKVPVMVWIHGGAFQFDTAANYDGTGLASQGGVIVITTNYRLGVLGFLNTGDDASPGNYGLWDQNLALQWVKQNIESFGGDVNKITLIGESAGAAGVGYHALSPHSMNLFHRVILQSGTATAPFALNRNPRKYALNFAARIGCSNATNQDTNEIVNCLRSQSVENIRKHSQGMNEDLAMSLIDFTWVPSVDGDFIPDDPSTLISDNMYLEGVGFFNYDLLLGMTNDEGSLVYKLSELNNVRSKGVVLDPGKGVSKDFYEDKFIPAIVTQKLGNATRETNLAMVYMYEKETEDGNDMVSNGDWFRTYSDATFLAAITQYALVHSSRGNTYLYLFDHKPSYNTDPVVTGTQHGGDVPYVFAFVPAGNSPRLNFTAKEQNFSINVIKYWSNMAKSGSPNLPDTAIPVEWPKFNQSKQKFLKLSADMSPRSIEMGLYSRRAEFWLQFLPAVLPTDMGESQQNPDDSLETTVEPAHAAMFIERFNIDAVTAEETIIGLAVVVAVLAAVVLAIVLVMVLIFRKKKTAYAMD